jgi:hypothetical protein
MTELGRIKHLLALASDYEHQAAECSSEPRKGEEMRKLSRTYAAMVQAQIAELSPGVHRIDDGLYVQIKGAGRSWVHRYQLNGKAHWSGLGPVGRMTLAEARAARDAERAMIRAGTDPVAARQAAAA